MRKEQIITTTNNNQMEEKGMKQRFIHFKRKFVPHYLLCGRRHFGSNTAA